MELTTAHRIALDSCSRTVASIVADQWNAATPCDEWDVRALVNHLVGGNRWAAELAGGATIAEVGDRLDGDLLGEEPGAAFDASAAAAVAAFDEPGVLDAPCAVSYGPVPGAVYLGHRFLDVLVHGWDLAVATGGDATLDPALVAACWQVIEPQLEGLQASGMFGSAATVPAGGDAQTRLLLALGRRPSAGASEPAP